MLYSFHKTVHMCRCTQDWLPWQRKGGGRKRRSRKDWEHASIQDLKFRDLLAMLCFSPSAWPLVYSPAKSYLLPHELKRSGPCCGCEGVFCRRSVWDSLHQMLHFGTLSHLLPAPYPAHFLIFKLKMLRWHSTTGEWRILCATAHPPHNTDLVLVHYLTIITK